MLSEQVIQRLGYQLVHGAVEADSQAAQTSERQQRLEWPWYGASQRPAPRQVVKDRRVPRDSRAHDDV